jgi:type II secretory pathway component PulC
MFKSPYQRRFFSYSRSLVALALTALAGLPGCSLVGARNAKSGPPLRRVQPSDVAKQELVIPKQQLVAAIQNQGVGSSLRLIPILKGESLEGENFPEYRVFGIKPGSIFSMLGLQNADVLVAADGYVVRDPQTFPRFVGLLKDETSATIEIRREDRPLVLSYNFK